MAGYILQGNGGKIMLGPLFGGGALIFGSEGILIQDPRRLTFPDWAATIVTDLGVAIAPVPETRWKQWAKSIYETTNLPPDPMPFSDWREWVLAWIRSA